MIWSPRSWPVATSWSLGNVAPLRCCPRFSYLMPRKGAIKLRCPICKKAVKNTDAEFPFCSDRCRSIDLGKWATGAYVIPSPLQEGEDEDLPARAPENDED